MTGYGELPAQVSHDFLVGYRCDLTAKLALKYGRFVLTGLEKFLMFVWFVWLVGWLVFVSFREHRLEGERFLCSSGSCRKLRTSGSTSLSMGVDGVVTEFALALFSITRSSDISTELSALKSSAVRA